MSNDTAVAAPNGPSRPAPPHEAPFGEHWEAVQEGPEWSLAEPGKKCRFRGSDKHACGEPAVVVLYRGIAKRIPWNYCLPHAYGRWVEDGKVMAWVLKDDEPGQATT